MFFLKGYKSTKKFLVVLIFILAFLSLIKVNIINTNALSPLGNTNENYEKIKDEFGEEFSNFIKDNSPVKIYEEKEDVLIKVGESEFKIDEDWSFTNIRNQIGEVFDKAKEKIEDIIYG